MRAHTNIKLKDRNSLVLSNFKGVDFSSSAVNVQSNRATYMRNIINEGGTNKKRNGWNEIKKYSDKINGIYEAPLKMGLIVHAGEKIYWHNTKVLLEGVKDARSQAFYKGDKMYLFCGDIFVLKFVVGEGIVATRLIDSDDIYIPTTTISIDNDTITDSARAVLDDINCLTKWRKNTLVGVKSDNKQSITQGDWTLDGSIDADSVVTVEIEIPIMTTDNMLTTKTVVATSGAISNDYNEKNTYYDLCEDGDWQKVIGVVNKKLGKIRIYGVDTTPPLENQANITVTFAHTHNLQDKITNCTFGALFGVDGNTDTLFLSGNESFKNICFYSYEDDFTYFPNKNAMAMGSDTYAINGFARLSDSTLVAVKEESSHEAGIYYISGSYQSFTDATSETQLVQPIYTRTAGGMGEGIVSKYACANLSGDALILTKNGVQGIVLGDNVARTERYTRDRSSNINAKLLMHSNLSEAVAIQHKDRYYLSVDGVCYVADARHKFIPNDSVDSSYNYEWWYWDNIPARVWASIDGQLYFGTNEGRICVFDNEYTDRTYVDVFDGTMLSVYDNNIVCDTNALAEVSENDRINLVANGEIFALLQGGATMDVDGTIHTDADNILNMHNNETIRTSKDKTKNYYIAYVDYAECTYCIVNDACEVVKLEGQFDVLLPMLQGDLFITSIDVKNQTFRLKAHIDGKPLVLYDDAYAYVTDMIVTHAQNVVAEYHTPVFDFGTIESSKTLIKMSIAVDTSTDGNISFGYETRNAIKLLNASSVGRFSFEDFSFQDFSFDTGFANSYSVRCNVRNFNYIMFRFVSDNDKNCAINNFTVIYKINKSNRGVR